MYNFVVYCLVFQMTVFRSSLSSDVCRSLLANIFYVQFQAMGVFGMILKDTQVLMSVKIALIPALIKCGVVCSDYQLLNLFDTLTNENERETLLQDCKQIDQSLEGLCRSVVRDHLKVCCHGRSIYNSVYQLPLPTLLKEFITFNGDYEVF